MDASKCKHIPGEKYKRSEVKDLDLQPQAVEDDPSQVYCGLIYRGKGTAVEGSIVYWPELNETRVLSYQTATVLGDHGRAKRILLGGDGSEGDTDGRYLWVPEKGLALASDQSGDVGASTDDTIAAKEEPSMDDAEKTALETAAAEAAEKATALEATVAELTAQAADNATALETLAASEKALRGVRVSEVERLAAILKREPELEAFRAAFGPDLATMPTDTLLELETSWAATIDETLPGGRQSTDTERDPATGEEAALETKAPERKSVRVHTLSGL
jgi:hypothetical protein